MSGVTPGRAAWALAVRCGEIRDFIHEGSKIRPVEQNVVDLAQEVSCGRVVGEGPVNPRQLQACAHSDMRQGTVHVGLARIARAS